MQKIKSTIMHDKTLFVTSDNVKQCATFLQYIEKFDILKKNFQGTVLWHAS